MINKYYVLQHIKTGKYVTKGRYSNIRPCLESRGIFSFQMTSIFNIPAHFISEISLMKTKFFTSEKSAKASARSLQKHWKNRYIHWLKNRNNIFQYTPSKLPGAPLSSSDQIITNTDKLFEDDGMDFRIVEVNITTTNCVEFKCNQSPKNYFLLNKNKV